MEVSKKDLEISPSVYMEFLASQELVMRDKVISMCFKAAMEENRNIFKNAIVLEVGCGSALLSMWAGRLGAARVIALEPSNVAQVARQLVRQNQLEHVIDVIQGNIEEITLPVDTVDIIISKWMGACLMYSTSLDSVIYARDKWLKPSGTIFPNAARLYITGATGDKENVSPKQFWSRFAGFNMSRVGLIMQQMPLVACINDSQLLSKNYLLQTFDLLTLKRDDLSFTTHFHLRATKKTIANLFVVYFEFEFPAHNRGGGFISISTSPKAPCTQWEQTVFHIDDHLPLTVGDVIHGRFTVKRGLKHLDFDIDWSCQNKLVKIPMHKQIYRMQG